MAMTGIQIFKLLPKTNCKDCGSPTCLAFAMALASGKAELDACPHVSEEAKAQLAESSAPPIRAVTIGTGDNALKVGGELVLYRHEKTFNNPTGLGVIVTDTMSDDEVNRKVEAADKMEYERVGLMLRPDLVAVKCESGDPAKFEALVDKVMGMTSQNLVIMSDNMDALKAGATAAKDRKPLIYAATKDNVDAAGELAKETACPLAVKGTSLDEVAELTETLTKAGLKDLVIDSGARDDQGPSTGSSGHPATGPGEEVCRPRVPDHHAALRDDGRSDEGGDVCGPDDQQVRRNRTPERSQG